MQTFIHRSIFLALALAVAGARGDEHTNRLHIDRWTGAGERSQIDESIVQRLGEIVGAGHFVVANVPFDLGAASSGEITRLFSFYSVSSPKEAPPKKQVLFLPDESAGRFVSGNANTLLAALFLTPGLARASDEEVSRVISLVLSSAWFGGKGRWLAEGNRPPSGFMGTRGPRTLAWKCACLREDGGVEEVMVAFPSGAADQVSLSRRELHPAGFLAVPVEQAFPLEEWTIEGAARWNPSSRYKMMTMMAALGNPTGQFQLAAALLQEPEEEARAEGLKWLRAAAAQGHRDAIDLLRRNGDELVRPDRDRDKVRVSRCCPVPGR